MVSVEEFSWNLKMLIKIAFPTGLSLHELVTQYDRYFRFELIPENYLKDCNNWINVFKGVPLLKQTFQITARKDLRTLIKVKVKPDTHQSRRDLRELFKFVTHTNFEMHICGIRSLGLEESDSSDDEGEGGQGFGEDENGDVTILHASSNSNEHLASGTPNPEGSCNTSHTAIPILTAENDSRPNLVTEQTTTRSAEPPQPEPNEILEMADEHNNHASIFSESTAEEESVSGESNPSVQSTDPFEDNSAESLTSSTLQQGQRRKVKVKTNSLNKGANPSIVKMEIIPGLLESAGNGDRHNKRTRYDIFRAANPFWRSNDIAIDTNGVAHLHPYTLPFVDWVEFARTAKCRAASELVETEPREEFQDTVDRNHESNSKIDEEDNKSDSQQTTTTNDSDSTTRPQLLVPTNASPEEISLIVSLQGIINEATPDQRKDWAALEKFQDFVFPLLSAKNPQVNIYKFPNLVKVMWLDFTARRNSSSDSTVADRNCNPNGNGNIENPRVTVINEEIEAVAAMELTSNSAEPPRANNSDARKRNSESDDSGFQSSPKEELEDIKPTKREEPIPGPSHRIHTRTSTKRRTSSSSSRSSNHELESTIDTKRVKFERLSQAEFNLVAKHFATIAYMMNQEPELTLSAIATQMYAPAQWAVCHMNDGIHGTSNVPAFGYYRWDADNNLFRKLNTKQGSWRYIKRNGMEIPPFTIVYGELATFALELDGSGPEVLAFSIIDCAVLDGVNLTDLPFEKRWRKCSNFLARLVRSKPLPPNTKIIMKPYVLLSNIENIFTNIQITNGLCTINFFDEQHDQHCEPIIGILFFRIRNDLDRSLTFHETMSNLWHWRFSNDYFMADFNILGDDEIGRWTFKELNSQ